MRFRNILRLVLVSFLISDLALAQETTIKPDSTIYSDIETYSRQSRFKTLLYRLVFKPVAPDPEVLRKKKGEARVQRQYATFEGKIIRNIVVLTFDPFGYTGIDSAAASRNFLNKAGNALHVKTRTIAIRNLLLFSRNQPFNTLLVKESERLIRNQTYVHDVTFNVTASGENSDSVDITIRELDKWSLIPAGAASPAKMFAGITDNNFLGSGHEFKTTFSRHFYKDINTLNTNYFIPNIRNTYISSRLHYTFDGGGNFIRSFAVDRPFYSPLTRWAAGIAFESQLRRDSLKSTGQNYLPVLLRSKTSDFWAGKAVEIFKENRQAEIVTNLIFTARYLRIRFSEKSPENNDPLHYYSDEDFFLGGIGITSRKYVQDKYIFKYGVTEDIPVGKVYSLTAGYQVKNRTGRLYLGMRYSSGNYFKWGYLSSNLEYGAFLHSSKVEQGVFSAGVNYSTHLFEIGKWKFRQFVKPEITAGINRSPYDSLTLNDGYGLDGFKSPNLSGTTRLLLTVQTQSYAPWSLAGFRFGPYLICSLGMIGDDIHPLKNSRVYSQLGLGVLIKNENLIFSTFQISVSFYPVVPGIGRDIFKLNSFSTTDFGFRDFEIQKPGVIIYR